MTPLEIIDKVEARLMDGTGRAILDSGACMYLDKKGRKCAVGIFIPDGHPAQKYLGPVHTLVEEYPKDGDNPLPDFFYTHTNLLDCLQSIHDNMLNWDIDDFIFTEVGQRKLNSIREQYTAVN